MRTSSLRGLGAWANVFAIESFIDELAEIAGEDPVSYRLSLLSDPRPRRVVETAARMSGWFEQRRLPEGRARGFGFARYKNIASFAAVVVEVEAEEDIRLKKIWCAADAGLVIAPDGAKNQLEGGIIQGASFVMREQVQFEDGRVATRTWEDYPILRFSRHSGNRDRADRQPERADAGARRGLGRPDRRRHRQRARPRARQAGARFAADAGADHGYAAGRIRQQERIIEGGCNDGSSGHAARRASARGRVGARGAGPAKAQELQAGKPIRLIVGLSPAAVPTSRRG